MPTKEEVLSVLTQNALEALQSFTALLLLEKAISKKPGIGNSHMLLAMNRMAWTSSCMALARLLDDHIKEDQFSLETVRKKKLLLWPDEAEVAFEATKVSSEKFKKFRNSLFGHSLNEKRTPQLEKFGLNFQSVEQLLRASCVCVEEVSKAQGQEMSLSFPDPMVSAFLPSIISDLSSN